MFDRAADDYSALFSPDKANMPFGYVQVASRAVCSSNLAVELLQPPFSARSGISEYSEFVAGSRSSQSYLFENNGIYREIIQLYSR